MPAAEPGPVVVDASAFAPDGATIDLLATLQLAAHRLGGQILLRDPSRDLQRLIAFAGLDEVLRVEPRREPEKREQPLCVEEEGQLLDPPI
jgi:anti-anti-sigma regulatory factor